MRKIILLLLLLPGIKNLVAQSSTVKNQAASSTAVNWPSFLSRSDIVFDTLTTKWDEGAFMGNGLLGAMIYMNDSNALRFEIGRADVVDNCTEAKNKLTGKCRFPIGHFVLRPAGIIISNTARVDLWNAEIRGVINTTKGSIQWRALVFSKNNVILVETETTGSEKLFGWSWIPGEPVNTSIRVSGQPGQPVSSVNTTAGLHTIAGNNKVVYYHQPLAPGGSCTTVWQSTVKLNKRTFYISIGYTPQNAKSDQEALNTIRTVSLQNVTSLITIHRNWWHQYYQQSFISLPDALLESFYWIQQYKLASIFRKGKFLSDQVEPWLRPSPLLVSRWNLNMQLTYSPLFTANHLDICPEFTASANKNTGYLIGTTPGQYRYNTLALYYYWLQYRYKTDKKILAGLFPILKRNTDYYLNILQKEEDLKYHLPYMAPPEYPDSTTRDCNYDLSLLRWSCQTLITINDSLKINDPSVIKWQDVLQNLTGYSYDTSGLRIGRDMAAGPSPRYFSHLLMIYPLHIMSYQSGDSDLIKRSIQYWPGNPGKFQGDFYQSQAAVYTALGKGNETRNCLHTLLTKFITPNTVENDQMIETLLPAATLIQEMCLHSWGDNIRIFPALPEDWTDISFKDLRAEGGFLISAVRKNKETKWVSIKAEADGVFTIQPDIYGVVIIRSANAVMPVNKTNGTYEITMRKGEEVLMYGDEVSLQEEPGVVAWDEKTINPFGKKK